MEKAEREEECAVREIMEETGVTGLHLKRKVGESFHVYNQFGKHFLKITHWFHITCSSKQQLIPQTEEDITEIKWVKTIDIKEPVSNTYPSIKDILAIFFDEP